MDFFKGFTNRGISFLKELARDNTKPWFEKNRPIYEECLLGPLKNLVLDLGPTLIDMDMDIETRPAVNKTISRIYRDVRFSKDKSPFRTEMWISFKRPTKILGNAPEFYFYFNPDEYQYGMGFYSASPRTMEKYRRYISLFPRRFKTIIDRYESQNKFLLAGDEYKRNMPNPLSGEYQKWTRKKNLYSYYKNKLDETFFSKGLKEEIKSAFLFNASLYHFLLESVTNDFKD